jgi:hypothetical protein
LDHGSCPPEFLFHFISLVQIHLNAVTITEVRQPPPGALGTTQHCADPADRPAERMSHENLALGLLTSPVFGHTLSLPILIFGCITTQGRKQMMKFNLRIGVVVVIILAMVGEHAVPSTLPDPLDAGWKGEPVCETLHEDLDNRILLCTFPPDVGHERHFHNRYFGYAVAGGRVKITDSTGTYEVDLDTGSNFTSDGVSWHEVINTGDSTIVYLIVEPK